MSKMEIYKSLIARLSFGQAIKEIQENNIVFPIDYDCNNTVWGVPTVDLLKYYLYQMFDLVYHNKKKEVSLGSQNGFITIRKEKAFFKINVGSYDKKTPIN